VGALGSLKVSFGKKLGLMKVMMKKGGGGCHDVKIGALAMYFLLRGSSNVLP